MSTRFRGAEPKTRWLIASLVVIAVNILLFGSGVGACTDYIAESGAESTCTSGPILGAQGTWVFMILSLFALAYFIFRLVRRPAGLRPPHEPG